MKKKRIYSVLSSLIIVMMLIQQLPVVVMAEVNVNAQNENIIEEKVTEENNLEEQAKEQLSQESDSSNLTEDKVTSENEITTKDEIISEDVAAKDKNETEEVLDNKPEFFNLSEEESQELDYEESKDDIVGEVYEYKNNISMYSLQTEVYEREEFNLKQQSFQEIEELQPKTDSNYEIALAHDDGSYTYVDSAENIDEALTKMEEASTNSQNNELARASFDSIIDNVVPVVLNSEGRVVSSTKAMGRILKHINGKVYGYFDINTNLYSNSSLTNAFTYINQGYVDDVPIIEDNGKSAKILVNGYQGWINRDVNSNEYDMIIVPINQVTNPSYYVSENGVLKHFITSNLRSSSKIGTTIEIGVAPSYLKEGVRYFSYDGAYFYEGSNIENGLTNLITDLQSNSYSRSVNSNNPYYNYYNYLPFRSTTTHTASDINNFIAKNTTSDSKLIGAGEAFIDAQNKYGVNALIALGVAINESDWGRSSIAKAKNNIFGINAVDSNPGQAADSYASVADSICEFAKNQISRAYSDPANWAYYGGFLGNKSLGANVKYASDPFWGEKASQYAFMADYYISGKNINNLKDYNNYQLAVFTSPTQVKNSSGQLLYNVIDNFSAYAAYVGTPVVIRETSGSNYAINPERNTPVNNGGTANKYHGNYNFNDKGYVNTSSVKFINKKKESNNPNVNKWVYKDGKYYYYDSNGNIYKGWLDLDGKRYYLDKTTGVMKTGWLKENNKWYYFKSNGEMVKGWATIDNYSYYFNSDGTMATGWKNINNKWYYFWSGGSMAKGWAKVGDNWYYLYDDGVMATGWVTVGGYKYYFWDGGSMATGWVKSDGNWYFLHASGAMAKGWVQLSGYWYYLDSNGVMVTGWATIGNKKYYFWGGGSMATGWINVDGKSYYLNPDGSLA